jgi:predicted nucleic acid-binding protein
MIYFLDASALAKRYLVERGTDRIRQLFKRNPTIAIARISEVEVASALVRRMNAGDLDLEDTEAHLAALSHDLELFEVVEIRKPVITGARELVRVHGLRAYDAVQLAAALRARGGGALTFLCADGELADAAEAEELRVERLQ